MVKTIWGIGCWGYLVIAAITCALMWIAGERWWPATMLLFAPVWVFALPAAPLILGALVLRMWQATGAVAVASLIVIFPVMGFNIPHRWTALPAGPAFHLRVQSFSVDGISRGSPHWQDVLAYVKAVDADVVVMQEWGDGPGGQNSSDGPGWHVICDSELRLWSRYPLRRIGPLIVQRGGAAGAAVQYEIQTPVGPVPLIDVHFASPHKTFRETIRRLPGSDAKVSKNSQARRNQADAVARAATSAGDRIIVAGDFNLPWNSEIYRHDFNGFKDLFAETCWGFGWTYRTPFTDVRIDHILTGSAWQCRRCQIGDDIGVPHRSLIVDLELPAAKR